MDDRELLELAAMAAKIESAAAIESHTPSGGMWVVGKDGYDAVWNPLNDDGDAFRLAVKLCLFLDMQQESVLVGWVVDKDSFATKTLDEDKGNDPYAAARRAIVRAASEIGKRMGEKNAMA